MGKILTINTDGGARGNPGPAGIGVVIRDENGNLVSEHKQYIGTATNNCAEYRALLLGLREAKALKAGEVKVNMDSELVVRQMQGKYKIKEPGLQLLAKEALVLIKELGGVAFNHVPREQNKEADNLVNQAIDEAGPVI